MSPSSPLVFIVFFIRFWYTSLSLILTSLSSRSTEHDHVKDNLPAKLLRIRTFGKMKLECFKDLISSIDYKTCEAKAAKAPTWYPLTLDIFVKFLYKVITSHKRLCCFIANFLLDLIVLLIL